MNFNHKKSDIPSRFYSEDTHEPFAECVSCKSTLESKRYFVEKAYKKYPTQNIHDVIFEYAICEDCAQQKNSELSTESKENIVQFFEEHTNKEGVSLSDIQNNKCLVSMNNLEDCDEYVIYGYFEGGKMLEGPFPYGLSGIVLDQITDLLSEQTIGEMDDFIGDFFSGPPEFQEILREKKWFFV